MSGGAFWFIVIYAVAYGIGQIVFCGVDLYRSRPKKNDRDRAIAKF